MDLSTRLSLLLGGEETRSIESMQALLDMTAYRNRRDIYIYPGVLDLLIASASMDVEMEIRLRAVNALSLLCANRENAQDAMRNRALIKVLKENAKTSGGECWIFATAALSALFQAENGLVNVDYIGVLIPQSVPNDIMFSPYYALFSVYMRYSGQRDDANATMFRNYEKLITFWRATQSVWALQGAILKSNKTALKRFPLELVRMTFQMLNG